MPTFHSGDFIKVKKTYVSRNSDFSHSERLKIVGKKRSSAFMLEDNSTWNAVRLSGVPYAGLQED